MKRRIRIVHDDIPCEGPRDWCNITYMACPHRRYDLGDNETTLGFNATQLATELCSNPPEWSHGNFPDDFGTVLTRDYDAMIMLPLYLYDHSGLTMHVGAFSSNMLPQGHAQYDTMFCGYIYMTRKQIHENYPDWKRLTAARKERLFEIMQSDVEIYNDHLCGAVFGWVVEMQTCEKCDTWEHEESCYGYYGFDIKKNGILEAVQYYLDKYPDAKLFDTDDSEIPRPENKKAEVA